MNCFSFLKTLLPKPPGRGSQLEVQGKLGHPSPSSRELTWLHSSGCQAFLVSPSLGRANAPVPSAEWVPGRLFLRTCMSEDIFILPLNLMVWAYGFMWNLLQKEYRRYHLPTSSYWWEAWCHSASPDFIWNWFFPPGSFQDLFPVLNALKFHEDESWRKSNFIYCARYLLDGPCCSGNTHPSVLGSVLEFFFKDSLPSTYPVLSQTSKWGS